MLKRTFYILSLITLYICACADPSSYQRSSDESVSSSLHEDTELVPTKNMRCAIQQNQPYPNGIPYVGIHGNALNNDFIDCETPDAWQPAWHSLQGLAMTQPNTFSPDGRTTYATTTNPKPDGCRLFAVDTQNGDVRWCQSYSTDIERGAIEVDMNGDLYFTTDHAVIALNSKGNLLWETPLLDAEGQLDMGWGVHFTPDGHVATVTSNGVVYILDRSTGDHIAQFDIVKHWSFVSPETFGVELDPTTLLPDIVQQDIRNVWGNPSGDEQAAGLSGLLGSGKFVDNTLGIAPNGDIYVIGGGPTPQQGALVKIKSTQDDKGINLQADWYAVTDRGSATSPSISPDGKYVVIADGAHPSSVLNPGNTKAMIKVYSIELCDANQDADPAPERCAVDWDYELERAPMIGAPAILEDGTVILWELELAFSTRPQAADVIAVNRDGIVWQSALPDDMDWTSVITVTRNHVIGGASKVDASTQGLPGFKVPYRSTDRVVVLDVKTGELVWYHQLPDDCAATVTVGPDGSLYVPMLGIFSILALEERPTLGLMKFKPHSQPQDLILPDLPMVSDEIENTNQISDQNSPQESLMNTSAACFDIEVEQLPTCCDEGPARCVTRDAVPESFASQLSACDDRSVCIPESVLTAIDRIEPQSCHSVGGIEGACLSKCLPEVYSNRALLPQDICADDELCVPCVSPLDQQDTGACGTIMCHPSNETNEATEVTDDTAENEILDNPDMMSIDPEDQSTEVIHCCGMAGVCLDPGIVPDEREGNLKNCRREGHRDLLCVPVVMTDPNWLPTSCMGQSLLGSEYEGVCLPDCLRLPFEFALDHFACREGYVCTPCYKLNGDPSGAPGCPESI